MSSRGSATTGRPEWLVELDQIYNPTVPRYRAGVVLLRGKVDDRFYYDYRAPEVELDSGLKYDQGRSLGGPRRIEGPAGPDRWDLGTSMRESGTNLRGLTHRGAHPNDPYSAIREVNDLFLRSGDSHVLAIFLNLNIWDLVSEEAPDVMPIVDKWRDELPDRGHLAIFAAKQFSERTAEFLRSSGVRQLEYQGPSVEAIRRRLLLEMVRAEHPPLDELELINEVAKIFAEYGKHEDKNYSYIVRELTVNRGRMVYDANWVAREKERIRPGERAEKKRLSELILNERDRAYVADVIIPSITNPEGYRRRVAAKTRRATNKIKLPRRIFLQGPPGTGKTSLAKAIATEAGVNFFDISAADLTSTYRGGPLQRVQDEFAKWRKAQPCIVFIDEVESTARKRDDRQHPDDPITQLLKELDSVKGRDEDIVLLCATNKPELLDSAFLRRISDLKMTIGLPDQSSREKLVEMYFEPERGLFAPDLTIQQIAQMLTDQSPDAISRCADHVDRILQTTSLDQITREMVAEWVAQNPPNPEDVSRWVQESEEQGRRYEELVK